MGVSAPRARGHACGSGGHRGALARAGAGRGPGAAAGRRWAGGGAAAAHRRRRDVRAAAAFDGVTRGLEKAWQKLTAEDELTEANIKEPLKDIRRALLEADVSLPVVRRFVGRVQERALGEGVAVGLKPDQKLVAVVRQELVALMGGAEDAARGTGDTALQFAVEPEVAGGEGGAAVPSSERPSVIMLAGLQGVGKTTVCGKLAKRLRDKSGGRISPMLVAGDVYRPAAVEQLQLVGESVGVPVYAEGTDVRPEAMAAGAMARARELGANVVIFDTAGRLQIDQEMMDELVRVKATVEPEEILLVVDAMTGQEAAKLVKSFDDAVGITGSVLTKLDGDTRGGAAISVFEVSGRPIRFVGTGERMDELEPFYPERMADRILGRGDILTLVEKLESVAKQEDEEEMARRLAQNKFDYNDFLKQSEMMGRMGAMNKVAKLIPGLSQVDDKQFNEAERNLERCKVMINAMTEEERSAPDLLVGPSGPMRVRRIASKAGVDTAAVKNLVGQFAMLRSQMFKFSSLMQQAEEKGIDPGSRSSAEMMDSIWNSVSEGRVKRRKGRAKSKKKKVQFEGPKRGFGS